MEYSAFSRTLSTGGIAIARCAQPLGAAAAGYASFAGWPFVSGAPPITQFFFRDVLEDDVHAGAGRSAYANQRVGDGFGNRTLLLDGAALVERNPNHWHGFILSFSLDAVSARRRGQRLSPAPTAFQQ